LPEGAGLPAKDRPILSAAIAAGATHLLTGDRRRFGPLHGRCVAGVLILRPADHGGDLGWLNGWRNLQPLRDLGGTGRDD
jgi:hypothetical protein